MLSSSTISSPVSIASEVFFNNIDLIIIIEFKSIEEELIEDKLLFIIGSLLSLILRISELLHRRDK
jgi:hypothetical protein